MSFVIYMVSIASINLPVTSLTSAHYICRPTKQTDLFCSASSTIEIHSI